MSDQSRVGQSDESDDRRRRAIERAAAVVPNAWSDISFAGAVLMTAQIIEEFERAMSEDDDD